MTSRALLAPGVVTPQPSVPAARTLSDAPTVITFLAVPGAPIEFSGAWCCALVGSVPSLPAEKISTSCWLPATPGWASRTMRS